MAGTGITRISILMEIAGSGNDDFTLGCEPVNEVFCS